MIYAKYVGSVEMRLSRGLRSQICKVVLALNLSPRDTINREVLTDNGYLV